MSLIDGLVMGGSALAGVGLGAYIAYRVQVLERLSSRNLVRLDGQRAVIAQVLESGRTWTKNAAAAALNGGVSNAEEFADSPAMRVYAESSKAFALHLTTARLTAFNEPTMNQLRGITAAVESFPDLMSRVVANGQTRSARREAAIHAATYLKGMEQLMDALEQRVLYELREPPPSGRRTLLRRTK
jgi:hypothetical protein